MITLPFVHIDTILLYTHTSENISDASEQA